MTSFGSKARSAVIWNAGFNLFRDLLQFGTMLVLVRLLKPESYGELAVVTSVMGFLSIFSHNNFIAHILQVKDEAGARYQEHFTAGSVIQVSIFLITNLVALALYWVPTYAPIAPFLHVMSITFLLEWPCELRRKMIEREFDWKRLRLLQAIGLIAGALLALAMAWAGAGTYTLLVPGMLVTLPFIYDLFVSENWRPTWTWSWDRYRPAWRFGLTRIGSGLVGSGRQLLESGVLTVVIGFAMLGVFGRAIGLAQMFCQKFASQLMYAIYPILTRIDGRDGDPTRVGGLVLRIVAWTAMPIAVVFAELAEPVVRVVYGKNWADVTPLLPWAMTWGVLSALSTATYMLLLAKNQTRLCLYADIGTLIGTVIALVVVLPTGLIAYLGALSGFQLVVVGLLSFWLQRHRALSLSGIIHAFAPPLGACFAAWGVLQLLVLGVYGQVTFSVFGAVIWGLIFSLLYLATLRIGFANQLTELVEHFPASKRISRALALKVI
jgi:O-antigen/teichoic acid export membrane protein